MRNSFLRVELEQLGDHAGARPPARHSKTKLTFAPLLSTVMLRCVWKDMASEFDIILYRARVLASPSRLDVWSCIGEHGMFSTDVGRTLGLSAATVSYHLAILEHAGLITRRRLGRNVMCRLTDVRWGVVSEAEAREMLASEAPQRAPTDHEVAI